MKKLLTSLSCAALLATTASADFARVEMGAGAWQTSSKGDLTYTVNSAVDGGYKSSEPSNTNGYAWLLVKHPVPVLPNIKLEYSSLSDEGNARGKFAGFEIPTNDVVKGSIDITQYDAVLYYNILDNTFWTTIDLGLDIRYLDTNFEAKGNLTLPGTVVSTSSYTTSETATFPMLYARGRVEVPATNFGFEVDGKYVSYDGSTIYDFKAKMDYTFDFVPVIQPAVELGYRVQSLDLSYDNGKTKFNLDFAGVYAGLMLRF